MAGSCVKPKYLNCWRFTRRSGSPRHDFRTDFRAQLKPRAKEYAQTVEWWYRDRYRLTANDPRFLKSSEEEWALDYMTDRYAKNPRLAENEFDNPDFESDVEAMMAAEDGQVSEEVAEPGNDSPDWEVIDE